MQNSQFVGVTYHPDEDNYRTVTDPLHDDFDESLITDPEYWDSKIKTDLAEDHPFVLEPDAPDENDECDNLMLVAEADTQIGQYLKDVRAKRAQMGSVFDDALRGWALRMTGSPEIAEEFVQFVHIREALVKSGSRLKIGGMSLEDFLSVRYPELLWALKGYIPLDGALAILAAYNKTGKSTLVAGIIKAITTGEPFCGISTTKCRVLLINFEERPADVQRRLKAFGFSAANKNLYLEFNRRRWDSSMERDVAETVASKDIKLVVIDSLSKIWKVEDENDNAKVGEWTAEFQAFWHRLGVTALAIHHSGKNGGSNGASLRGASAIGDNCDIYWEYGRLPNKDGGRAIANKNVRKLSVSGRYEIPDDIFIEFNPATYAYSIKESGVEDLGNGLVCKSKPDPVSDLLKSGKSLSVKEITNSTDAAKSTVSKKLKALIEAGYRKTQDGEDADGNPRFKLEAPSPEV